MQNAAFCIIWVRSRRRRPQNPRRAIKTQIKPKSVSREKKSTNGQSLKRRVCIVGPDLIITAHQNPSRE